MFRLRIGEATSEELRELGEALVADFYRVRTREELLEEGPVPDDLRVRSFALAGVVSEELLRRDEEPLERYILAIRRFASAMSSGEKESMREEKDQEHRAG